MKKTVVLVLSLCLLIATFVFVTNTGHNKVKTQTSPTPTHQKEDEEFVLITKNLPSAKLNKEYLAEIEAYSLDLNKPLSIKITNMPKNLSISTCSVSKKIIDTKQNPVQYINCKIEGFPVEYGDYQLVVILATSEENVTARYIKIQVSK